LTKVFPISLIKTKKAVGATRIQTGDVQKNVDANVGFRDFQTDVACGRVAIVGYGPSLARTWEDLKNFDGQVWTVSAAHDFLLEKGIFPNYHTDTEWRAHKSAMLKQPQADCKYVMSNTIHPIFALKVRDYDVEMFQPVPDVIDNFFRLGPYPRINALGDAGITAIQLAAARGFTEIETYGFDYSHDFNQVIKAGEAPTATHAGPHDGVRSPIVYVTDEKFNLYETSNNLLMGCAAFWEMMTRLPETVQVSVNSDGLLPAWIDMKVAGTPA
jgi:hypothetical protein